MTEKKTCGGYSFKSFAEIGQEAEAWRKAYRKLRDEVRASHKKAHLLKGIIMNAIAGGSELNLLEPLTEEEFDALEFKPNPHRHPEFWRLARTAAKDAKSYAHLKKLLSKLPKPDQEG